MEIILIIFHFPKFILCRFVRTRSMLRHVPSSALLLLLTSVHFRHCPLPVQDVFVHILCRFFPIPSPVCHNLSFQPPQNAVLFASGTPNVPKLSSSSPYAFLLRRRMAADVSGTKSRENSANAKHRKASEEEAKYCPKEWASLSQKQQNGRKSGEKRRPTKAFTEMPMPSMPKTFTPSPPIRTTTTTTSSWTGTTLAVKKKHWSSSTVKMVAEDRRHRSASASVEKSAERHAKLTHRSRSTENIHRPNNLNNKNSGRRGGGTATKPHHKRGRGGGGKTASNWRIELSSAEQSIALMLRCQELDTRELLPSATTCRNLRSDKVCNYLFQEIETKTGQRDVKCNLQGLEDIAESCRKTCGICCEDINYACEDDQNGIVDCSRQLDKCHQKKWFGVLSRFCAGSCGLCAMSACRDYDNSCRVRKALCLKPEALDYMRENCGRTCGFCVIGESSAPPGGEGAGGKGAHEKRGGTANAKGNSGKPVVVGRPEGPPKGKHRLVVPECTDKVDNCTANVHLCNSPHLGEYMIKFCTKTCLKCGEAQTTKTNGKSAPEPPPIEVIIEPMMETPNNKNAQSSASNSNNRRTMTTNKCVDREERCIQWRTEGLCNNSATSGTTTATKFNGGQRRACAKTCGDCK